MEAAGIDAEDDPSNWSNSPDQLIQQNRSLAAIACKALDSKSFPVRFPAGVQASVKGKTIPLALEPATRLLQDAYQSANSLVVLDSETQVPMFLKSESLELTHAATGRPPPDGTIAPRPEAFTLLSYANNREDDTRNLLDAMQFLACEPSSCRTERAASTTRVAMLAGASAVRYAGDRQSYAEHGYFSSRNKSQNARDLCLVWTTADASGTVRFHSGFAAVPRKETAAEYAQELQRMAMQIWDGNSHVPKTRLTSPYPIMPLEGFYVQTAIDCASDFWGKLVPEVEMRKSRVVADGDWKKFDFSYMYVRLVERAPNGKAEINGEGAYHGLLLHQKGMDDEIREYCRRIRDDEHSRPDAGIVWGLRPPATRPEEIIAPHVLSLKAEPIDLGDFVTTYGLLGSPGKSLSSRSGAWSYRLVRRLEALDNILLTRAFVLPCDELVVWPAHGELLRPLFDQLDLATWDAQAEFAKPSWGFSGKRKLELTIEEKLEETRRRLPKLKERAPSKEEEFVLTGFGLGLDTPALRVGDALKELKERQAPEALCRLFMTMAQLESPECGISDAMESLLSRLNASVVRISTLEKEAREAATKVDSSALHDASITNSTGVACAMRGLGKRCADNRRVEIDPDDGIDERYVRGVMLMCAASLGVKRKAASFPQEVVDSALRHVVKEHVNQTRNVMTIVGTFFNNIASIEPTIASTRAVLVVMEKAPYPKSEIDQLQRILAFDPHADPTYLALTDLLEMTDASDRCFLGMNDRTWEVWAFPPLA